MKLSVILIPILFLLSGCEEAFLGSKPNSQPFNPENNTVPKEINLTNQTNVTETIIVTVPKEVKVFLPREDNLTVYFLDIKGDATIAQFNSNSILVDAGFEEDSTKVLKSIRDLGIDILDYVFATNTQPKNIGGMPYIILRTEPDNLVENGVPSSISAYKEYKDLYNSTTVIIQDRLFHVGNFFVKTIVIYDDGEGFSLNLDDNSLITRISYGNTRFLLMSDCGLECEERLKYEDVSADVLKISRSCDSTSLSFLQRVKPKVAIVSYSEEDFCPHLVDRFEYLNIPLHITGEKGDIFVTTDGLNSKIDWKKED